MPSARYNQLTRTALLLALTLLFQSLRFIIPLPALLSTLLIGTLVNACLLIAAEAIGLRAGLAIAVMAPVVAYLQQLLPLPVFILPVLAGNAAYVLLFILLVHWRREMAILIAGFSKTVVLYGFFSWMLTWIAIPGPVSSGLLFVMSWPQLVTAIAGGILAGLIAKRIRS